MRLLSAAFATAVVVSVTVAAPSARNGHVQEQSLRLGGTPFALLAERGSLWVLTCDRRCSGEGRKSVGRIVRVDPRSGRVVASVTVHRPQALAVDEAGVYGLDFWGGYVYRLDPATLRVSGRARLVLPFQIAPGDNAFLPENVATGEGAVWVSSNRGVVAKVDLRATRVVATIRLPPKAPGGVAAGEGAVWVAGALYGLFRIDPKTNRVVARIRIGRREHRLDVVAVVIGGRQVLAAGPWVSGLTFAGGNGLARIDPKSGRLEGVTPLPGGDLVVAFGAGSLWAARVGSSLVERIDPGTGRVIDRVRAEVGTALAVAGGYLWTAARDGTLRRVATP